MDGRPPSPQRPIDWTDDDVWTGTRAPVSEATGLWPAAYTDDQFFALERQRLYARGWVCVALTAELSRPGQVLVRTVGDRSVLITTDDRSTLRGFLNSCRHRGTELCEQDTTVSATIRCPYHRWGYELDGTLVSTPGFDEVARPGFDRAQHGLWAVRVDTWGGLVFACLDPATMPLATWLGDLPDRLAGYRLDRWRVHDHLEVDIAANWKLIAENFAEYYHLAWVHPALARVSRVDDHYRYQGPGMYCGQTTTPVSGDDRSDWLALPSAADLDASDQVSGRFVTIFPNVLLSVLPNHALVMRLEPTCPGHTREVCSFLVPDSTGSVDEEVFDLTRRFWLDINGEDIGIVERGQRGLHRGAAGSGPLVPRFEEPVHRFHNMLADCLTTEDAAEIRPPDGDGPGDVERLGNKSNPIPPAIDRTIGP